MPTDHLGGELPSDRSFFVPAPVQIGEVRSQFSTLKEGDSGTVSKKHVQMSVGFALVAVFSGVAYVFTKNIAALAVGMLFFAFAILRALNTKRFECNYVGSKGFARFRVGTKDETTPGIEGGVFTFDEAAHLFTNVIETQGLLPFYGQNAIYQWVPAGKLKARVNIMTDQYDPRELPTREDVICFLRAAEKAWTESHFESAKASVESGGVIEFPYRVGGKFTLSNSDLTFPGSKKAIPVSDVHGVVHTAGDVLLIDATNNVLWKGNCFHFGNLMLFEKLLVELFGFLPNGSGIGLYPKDAPVPIDLGRLTLGEHEVIRIQLVSLVDSGLFEHRSFG